MNEKSLFDLKHREAVQTANAIESGDGIFNVLYRLPASDDFEYGYAVGWILANGIAFMVCWTEDGIDIDSYVRLDEDVGAPFPHYTSWMITDNDAIEHGIESGE